MNRGERQEVRNHLRQSAKSAGNKTRAIRVLQFAFIRAICAIRVPPQSKICNLKFEIKQSV